MHLAVFIRPKTSNGLRRLKILRIKNISEEVLEGLFWAFWRVSLGIGGSGVDREVREGVRSISYIFFSNRATGVHPRYIFNLLHPE